MTLPRLFLIVLMSCACLGWMILTVSEWNHEQQEKAFEEYSDTMRHLETQCRAAWPRKQERYQECLRNIAMRYDL